MRFTYIEGSQSGHCCFGFTVVDTRTPRNLYEGDNEYEQLCECFEEEDAKRICDALNAYCDSKEGASGG